jgi:hypothetical protein
MPAKTRDLFTTNLLSVDKATAPTRNPLQSADTVSCQKNSAVDDFAD